MKKFLLTMSMICLSVFTFAQSVDISGTVTSADDGIGLPGVSVTVQGTIGGTTTDVDGNYNISVDRGGTLVFSFVGMNSQSIVIGNQSVINLALTSDLGLLAEIVVTSTGISRNAREVVYANQTVKAEDLTSTPNKNALEALRGKISGVKISTNSGSVGASTRIVLRGEGSLTGNNNALIVVDGIPIDNTSTRGGDGTTEVGYSDFGSRFNDINPEDIESITVLKGPSATSLYGSRGASGVLLITTKKGGNGEDGKIEVGFKTSYSTEKAYVLMQRQDQFGQGYDGVHFDSGENWSWGPAFDGVVRPWTSPVDTDGDGALEALTRPFSAVPNQLQSFFDLGNTLNNNINLSGAKGGFTYYMSYGNTNQKGVLSGTKYLRNSINLNASAKLSSKLKTDFKVSYALTDLNTAQEGSRAFEGNNAYAMVVQSPVNIPINELRDYNNPFHGTDGYWGSYSSVNPYYILNEFGNQGKINNLFTKVSLTYTPIKNLDLIARIGTNVISTDVNQFTPPFIPAQQLVWTDDLALATRSTRHESLGNYTKSKSQRTNLDISALANYSATLTEDFSLNATIGYNLFDRSTSNVSGFTNGGLVVPGWYNLSNSVQTSESSQSSSSYRLFGVLGNASIGYKNMVFLEYSARNDWSSTLPSANNSFFYQAVGTSVIVTDLLDMKSNPYLNHLKVRASIGTTGKDAGLYLLNSTFIGNPTLVNLGDHALTFPLNGQSGFTVSNQIGNPDLRPELTTTYEFGTDVSLFNNRINVDYTYYRSNHSDQIVTVDLPASSGFTSTTANIGEMINKGHELAINFKPIQGLVNDLTWDLDFIYSKNTNEVIKITDDIDELSMYSFRGVSIVAKEGYPFGTFKALAPKYNDAGQVIVGATGFPELTDEEVLLDSYQPDFMASIGTSIGYKGFSLSGLLDIKRGGSFYSLSKFSTEFNGTALHTTENNREPFVIENSVVAGADGSFTANTTEVTSQDYYTNYDAAPSTFLIDASYVKLREISLNYRVPSAFLNKAKLNSLNLGVYATNVKFWLPAENTYGDPEVNGPSLKGNAAGIETTQTPPAQSLGVKLSLTF